MEDFKAWARTVIMVVFASLVLPSWTSPRTFLFQASTRHTACDGSDYDGQALGHHGTGSYFDSGGSRSLVVHLLRRDDFLRTALVFSAPRGTLLVMRSSPMVQLPPACTSVRTGLRTISSLSLWTAVPAAAMVSPMSGRVWFT